MIDRRRLLAGAVGAVGIAAVTRAAAAPTDVFQVTSLALYLPEAALEARGPTADVLSAFLDAVTTTVNVEFMHGPAEAGVSGSLVVGMKPPSKSRFWWVVSNHARQAALAARLKGPLEAVPAPLVRGWNAVAINFNAWGGDGQPHPPFMPVPDEWRSAPIHGGILPDAPLEAIWTD